jgi:hypothetical protein
MRHRQNCYICIRANDPDEPWREAVALCNELNQPVCEKHAKGCVEDGHGHRPLKEE